MAALAPRLLPQAEDDREQTRMPVAQICLLLAAVLLVSTAGTTEVTAAKAGLITVAAIAVGAMLVMERRGGNRLLPSGAVTLGQPISRVYLTMIGLNFVLVSDIFVPYFLQVLHGVTPLVSGYLVALVALGWTVAAFFSGSFSGRKANAAIVAGCLTEAVATAVLAVFLARENPQAHLVILGPAAVAMFMMGFGVGLGWAHLVAKVLKLVADSEQDKASAAIPTMSSLGSAFGAAFAGVIANGAGLVEPGGIAGTLSAASWLYLVMALPGLIATGAALSLAAPARTSPPVCRQPDA
jgi:hypothetical protein